MRERAYVLLEGDRDADFFNSILYQLFKKKFRIIEEWKYSQEEIEDTRKFINKAKKGTCIFLHDFDKSNCFTEVKKVVKDLWAELDETEIHIVKDEIESWYLAGISIKSSKKMGITNQHLNTENISKGDFLNLKPRGMTKTVFYETFLMSYDLEKAKDRNLSLKRFIEKLL
jgi:hypothetical protein